MAPLQWKNALLGVGFVAVSSSLLIWYEYRNRPVPPEIARDLRRLVRQYPTLAPRFGDAATDGVITMSEADAIVAAATTAEPIDDPHEARRLRSERFD